METIQIIYIAVAVAATALVCYFIFGRKKSGNKDLEDAIAEKEELQNQLGLLTVELNQERTANQQKNNGSNSSNSDNNIKSKYEKLLSEANARIAELDKQLKNCTNGKIDESVKGQLAEVDKLKKKIKDLQDEIDDNEDDIDELKKKLKKKDGECNELQDKLTVEQKAGKQLKEDLDNISLGLEMKAEELNLKKESLLFVQEVLSAKVVSDDNVKLLHSRIDNVKSFISGEMRDKVKKYYTINNEDQYFGSGLTKWAISSKKTWIKGKTTIALVGEFSAGKTSIVNRILSQDDPKVTKLPVSTKATTAIPTYISGGPATSFNFVTPANVQKYISEETFKKVNKEVLDQVKGVSSLIQYFVMTYKNPNLNNLSILDTPGFNSNDKEDAERTIEVINECDALFWVFDVNAGTVNRSSIQLIKQNLKKPLYVVINKVDSKATSEVDKVENLIRETLQNEGVAVQKFIRFSQKNALQDIMAPIKTIQHDNANEVYVQSLQEMIQGIISQTQNSVSELNRTQSSAFKNCDALVSQYNDALGELHDNCVSAAGIPHWETHFFGSDRYEMSSGEYSRLTSLLDTICSTNTNDLCDLYNEQMEAQRKAQQAYSDFVYAKAELNDLIDCQENLNKLLKQLD